MGRMIVIALATIMALLVFTHYVTGCGNVAFTIPHVGFGVTWVMVLAAGFFYLGHRLTSR